MKIIDCFTFYNELDLLNYRLNILNDVVDYFIIIEATHTFVGKEKNLFYEENKNRFDSFKDKIIHIIVDDFPYKFPNINFKNKDQWVNENFQRNSIKKGLDKLELNNDDIIIISDLDEIPDPNTLKRIKNNEIIITVNTLELDFYYYNLNSKQKYLWKKTKILSFEKYKELSLTCEQIRQNNYSIIKNGGWHLSYFGDKHFIKNKLENFGHQEFNNNKFTNLDNIENNINNYNDLFNRLTDKISKISIKDNKYLPVDYDTYLVKYIRE
jgi:beta-1,4-mannosyl-glycoprotein beta-1,4-N-acetylglucosaminyltransferase